MAITPHTPDHEVWDAVTGETFGEARARFAEYGPEVPTDQVASLVRAGKTVWSFGYGDDPEGFTTIEDGYDLEWFDLAAAGDTAAQGVVASWAPFRLDVMDTDQGTWGTVR